MATAGGGNGDLPRPCTCTCILQRFYLCQSKKTTSLLDTLVSRDKELTKSDTRVHHSLLYTSTLCYPLLHYSVTLSLLVSIDLDRVV
jgi:hypothetical protein